MAIVIDQLRFSKPSRNTSGVVALVALALVIVSGEPAFSDEFNSKVGTKAYSFLKRDIGARASSLGGAFTGLADDESALYYNPAGLGSLAESRVSFSYQNFVAGINAGFLSYVSPRGENQAFGGYLNYINYGEFVRTQALTGAELGTFGATSLVLGGAYSRNLNQRLQVGAALKVIYANWDTFTSTGAAVDLGVRYTIKRRIAELEKRGFGYVGLSVLHLGKMLSAFTIDAEKDPLPTQFRLGAAGRPRGLPVLFSADLVLPTDNDLRYAFGAEYSDIEKLALRVGWNSIGGDYKTTYNESALAGFAFGLGFHLKRLTVDYSISPMNDLGETHRITVSHLLGEALY